VSLAERARKPVFFVDADGAVSLLGADESGAPEAGKQGGTGASVALVSDVALRWLVLPWNVDLLRERSANAQLDLHAELMFGGEPGGLVYAQAYAPYGRPQCVAGLPKPLLETIQATAREKSLAVTSVQPLSWVCWERFRKDIPETSYLFAVIERSAVTLIVVAGRRVERVVARGYLENTAAELIATWRRMQLREPQLADVTALYAVDLSGACADEVAAAGFKLLGATREPASGEAEAAEHTATGDHVALLQIAAGARSRGAVDFITTAPPVRGWRSALLVAGLACLALLGARAGLAYNERTSLSADAEEASVVIQPAPRTQSSRAQIRSVNQAITALNLPVGALLKNIQPPRELHTALLGLDLSDIRSDTHTAAVKITAESRTGAEMTAYVELLSRSRIFESVFLTRHEIVESGGEHPYRYEVEAAWRQ
jgi:hypothetical protein